MDQTELVYQELLKIVDKRSIFLDFVKLPEEVNGFWFRFKDDGIEVIAISEAISGRQRNFTLAHELGHSALHKGSNHNVIANGGKSDPKMEKEADDYARQLLRDIRNRLQREAA